MRQTEERSVFKKDNWEIYETKLKGQDGEKDVLFAKRPSNVYIVALDKDENIFLVSEHCACHNKQQLTLPKGKIKQGETPLEAAQREIQEEIKFFAKKIIQITELEHDKISGKTYVFFAKELVEKPKKTEFLEELTVIKKSLSEILNLIEKGYIKEEKTVASILYFNNFKNKLTKNKK